MRLPPLLILLAAALFAAAPAPGGEPPESVELAFLLGEHADLAPEIQPVTKGGLEIQIRTTENRMTVYGNRLALRRDPQNPPGLLGATFDVDFDGEGRIEADVRGVGSAERHLADRVVVERQSLHVEGKIRLERLVEGYRLEIVEAPPSASIAIRSGLAGQIVGVCRLLAKIPFVPISCDGLEEALSSVRVPLPRPGQAFVILSEKLGDEEKAFLDAWTAAAPSSTSD